MAKKKDTKKPKLKHRPLPLLLAPHRERLHMSQMKLGERCNMSDASISRIETGQQNWDQEFLQEAAFHLGVHWLELLPLAPEVKAEIKRRS